VKEVTEKIRCDLCGAEIENPQKEWSVVVSDDGRDVISRVIFFVSGVLPYCTANPDICKACVKKYAERWVDSL